MIRFTKVRLPYGWLSNMAPFPIMYNGKRWLTSEALFQAMRFDNEEIIELIRAQRSPMSAKMKAKANKLSYIIEPMSEQDVANMKLCVKLKIEQHPLTKKQLLATGTMLIVEDIESKQLQNISRYKIEVRV